MNLLTDGLHDFPVKYGRAFLRVVQGFPVVAELDYKLPKELVLEAVKTAFNIQLVLGVVKERVRLPMVIFRIDTKELLKVPAKQVEYEILQAKRIL